MPYTLTREQRDALHAEAITELAEIGDLYLALKNDDYRLAQDLWRRYGPLLLLLDQVGWEPTLPDDATVVEVAMPDGQLASAAARLTRVALGRLRHQIDQQQLKHDPDADSARPSPRCSPAAIARSCVCWTTSAGRRRIRASGSS